MMMKFFTLLSLFGIAHAQTLDAAGIRSRIKVFQDSRPQMFLSSAGVLDTTLDTYQKRARERVVTRYAGVVGGSDKAIRNYYVLACIYEATYQRTNPRVNQLEPNKAIPGWKTRTGWFTEPNYCKWFGVQCFDQRASGATQASQEANSEVLAINLSENDLYGEWPSEVGLLGSTLLSIDLYNNFFLWTVKFNWLGAMTALKYLFFGSTSFDSNGIPFNLRFVTNLEEMDFSNTFWRGTLTENSFNNLKKLRYLDMGQNFFDLSGLTTIPDYISGLPLITNLYVDNIRSTKTGFTNQNVKLTFITRMPNIVEMWADYTNVNGAIPALIGNAKKLRSFSVAYCKLTGTLPASIVNTALERFWAYGNPNLKGNFPSGFGNLDWRILQLEGTGITAAYPKAVCEQVGPNELTSLLILGGNCNTMCTAGCCTCCGQACGSLRTPTASPSGGGFGICFSGDSTVVVENQGPVKMSNLELGDSIQVADNKFETIYSFGHINHDEVGKFLTITAEGNRKIELSEDHMVTIEGGRNVPASMIQRGDKLLTASGELAAVKTIREVKRQGVYAPFTSSGKIVVNDIVASSYVSFQGEENLHIAGVETPLSFHWIAHIFKSVHRIAYKLGLSGSETYTTDGTSQWVAGPREAGLWLLEQSPVVLTTLLIPAIVFFGIASSFEFLFVDNVFATAAVGLLTLLVARRFVSVKMTHKM